MGAFVALQEEQEAVIESKEMSGKERLLTWEDTRNMPLTSRVILETLRVASILSFTFREAVEDVEYGGEMLHPLLCNYLSYYFFSHKL